MSLWDDIKSAIENALNDVTNLQVITLSGDIEVNNLATTWKEINESLKPQASNIDSILEVVLEALNGDDSTPESIATSIKGKINDKRINALINAAYNAAHETTPNTKGKAKEAAINAINAARKAAATPAIISDGKGANEVKLVMATKIDLDLDMVTFANEKAKKEYPELVTIHTDAVKSALNARNAIFELIAERIKS